VARTAVAPPPEEEEPVYQSRSRWPAALLIIVLMAAIIAGLLLLAKSLGVFGKAAATKLGVPNVIGVKYEPNARQIIEQAGLVPAPLLVNSDSPEGVVITTEPSPSTQVDRGSLVRVTVSAGKQTLKVPDLTNKVKAEAEKAITTAGFTVGREDPKPDDKIDKDRVVSQDPGANTDAPKGSAINLVISTGKEKVKVPDVAGKEEFDAVQILSRAGLQVDRKDAFSDTVGQGTVIRSDPAAGTDVDKGSTVTIFTSQGSEKVKMPNVTGLEETAAKSQLEGLGLTVNEVNQDTLNPTQVGKVISQSPAPGTDVKKGDTVTITVGRSPATSSSTTTTTKKP
jgi:serine/threonine-protein kinase